MTEPAGMEFPAFLRLRVVGRNDEDFAGFVFEQLLPLLPDLTIDQLDVRPSSAGNYMAVHVAFVAESREHLDGIYLKLNSHERVLWVL